MSFFEYFYAQYIFLRIRDVNKVYNSLQKFDVDSEVFELTIAMMKQKDEPRYQELIEYILEKMDDEAKTKSTKLPAFNILTLGMQVVDDNLYVCKFIEYLVKNKLHIVKNIEHIANQIIVYNVICSNDIYIKQVIKEHFYNDLFAMILSTAQRGRTATEVNELKEEFIKKGFING